MLEQNDSGQVPQNEDEADRLLESIESNEQNVEQPAPPAKVEEYSIKYGGKEIKAPLDKVLRWAEQGYDAPNKIGELNKKLTELTARETHLKELEQKYKQVDEYVRKNPDWWTHVTSQYDQLKAQQTGLAPEVIAPLKQELDQLKQGFQTIEQEREQARIKQEDEVYRNELETIKKSYPKVDFSSQDESGKSLEYRVLDYAVQNGIKKFTTAFRDFYHDEILKMKEEEAKEKVITSKQTKTKLGILDISSTPSRKVGNQDVRGRSYNDIEKDILSELGLN